MADIRDIGIRNVEVRDIRIPSWMTDQPRLPSAPPVTVYVGVPVIDIPGCVEAHLDNKKELMISWLRMTLMVPGSFVMVICHLLIL